MIIPVILAGGSGSRLWPLSRELYPKQFLPVVDDQSMLQSTLTRLSHIAGAADPIVVCNNEHRFIAAEQCRNLGVTTSSLILEPEGRNTAPAVAVAALKAIEKNEDAVLLVLPADHHIAEPEKFAAAVAAAGSAAADGSLVTFGVRPTAAETGYGYIRAPGEGKDARPLEAFVEKPELELAKKYLESPDYFWNSGMFVFKAEAFLEEARRLVPEVVDACAAALKASRPDMEFVRLDEAEWRRCPSDSIDYAVMEKTEKGVMIPLDAAWSDVGSWSAVRNESEMDESGNVARGDVYTSKSKNCLFYGGNRMMAGVGIEDIIVVDTLDAVLVAHADHVQSVKDIVESLKIDGRPEARLHRKVYRPWGSYDSIDSSGRFQVKRLTVLPGAILSLQMHHHRAEHWIVVSRTALVTKNDDKFLLHENQSTYIPMGTTHRLENPGKIDLEIIEVQCGAYLGEDDIVRFEDNYGRENEVPAT